MDYVEEYLKYRVCNNMGNNKVRLDWYFVKDNKIIIKYLIYSEPNFCPMSWTFEAHQDKYEQWERQYLRIKKINTIKNKLKN